MRPIDAIGPEEAARIEGLLFDLDDTLLDHGRLTEAAYSALFRWREAGLKLLAVTGRPAGWGEVLVRQWPVEAVITENGAIALRRRGSRVELVDTVGRDERAARQRRLQQLAAELRQRFPELQPTEDLPARVSDYTFDIGEHCQVSAATVREVEQVARERGARTMHSSVHLHLSLDGDDKASGAIRLLRELYRIDPAVARTRFAFIGDSSNDASCYAAFRTTLAVANFTGELTVPPRYITDQPMGAGFAEATAVLLARRDRAVEMGAAAAQSAAGAERSP